ncbi:MAG: DUF6266 family protein [Bacteroidota bacterium]|nr:DUF6266 family protein [Bacteroidota bacterium]
MSVAQNPLLGPMRNSMGNFTVYTLNGMNIVRSKPFKVKDAKSEKQLNMRARMTLFAKKYHELGPIINLGFPEREVTKSPQNMFVSVNFTTAFVMVDKLPVISYPLMLLAKGSLPPVTIPQALIDAGGITINYDARALLPEVTATDEIIACALLKSGGLLMTRQFIGYAPIGTLHLNYPALQAEQVACCYAFVRSGDGSKASDSVYVEVKS